MSDDLTLLCVASNGSVEQWDQLPTPTGILLRWFHGALGFPDYGYDVYRAHISDFHGLNWATLAGTLNQQKQYTHQNDLTLSCLQGFSFRNVQDQTALTITPQNPVTIDFLSPAWYAGVTLAPLPGNDVTVSLYIRGVLLGTQRLTDANRTGIWPRRGIDQVVISGQGAVWYFNYYLINQITQWTWLTHLCLPVTHPAYAGGSNWQGSDEDEASRRLPPKADWAGKYAGVFKVMYPTLVDLALRKNPGPVAASTDPDAPKLALSTDQAVQLAALNPHVARMLGLAWDDPLLPAGLDGRMYAYKVVGRWLGETLDWTLDNRRALAALKAHGFSFRLSRGSQWVRSQVNPAVSLAATGMLTLSWQRELTQLVVTGKVSQNTAWEVLDENGRVLDQGKARSAKTFDVVIKDAQARSLRFFGPVKLLEFLKVRAVFKYTERVDVLPVVVAKDPGAPGGPQQIDVTLKSFSGYPGKKQARLTWDLPVRAGSLPGEFDPVFYQVAGLQLDDNPDAPAPALPPYQNKFLLRHGDPLALPQNDPEVEPCYYMEGPLGFGWRAWWVRGVDLFGRVSAASAPVEICIPDNALPAPPALLLAEYVQGELNATQQNLAGYSATGRSWLAANPGNSGLVTAWAWTPELSEAWPDVDGFRLQVRRPLAVSDPSGKYPGKYPDDLPTWGPVRFELGPLPVSYAGKVVSVFHGIPKIRISNVNALDSTHAECQTDLRLDVGQAALLGQTLNASPEPVVIKGHGEGPAITMTVEHPEGKAPVPGTYDCLAGSAQLFTLDTTIQPAPVSADPFVKLWVGALAKEDKRWAVLSMEKGRFLCLGEAPAVGEALAWFPAYVAVLPDKGFGPQPAPDVPVAYAQVTVLSVRRMKTRALQSWPGTPGTVQAVDCTPPATPVLPNIPSGPYCAQWATRADWYGISRFTLTWPTVPNTTYQVFRAISDAIFTYDREAYGEGAHAQPHPFLGNPDNVWPADVLAEILGDANRRQIVQQDLARLDAALATGADKTIRGAYRDLHADTQRLLAGQPCTEAAYAGRTKKPLEPGQVPFTDEMDGKSRTHWFYRVSALSLSGLESPQSSPTPPICCPDVVPPAKPIVMMALAAPGQVRLQWQAVPDDDLACYRVYRAGDAEAARDVRSMEEVAQLSNPAAPAGKPAWREYLNPAPAGHDWYYRITAEDDSGNISPASDVLKGRALALPPEPPVWNEPVRTPDPNPTQVSLSWTHLTDARLACLVERRALGSNLWQDISGWLPRSVYACLDAPPDIALAWEYRLRVKDHLGKTAVTLPTAVLMNL